MLNRFQDIPLILASSSPRREMLLRQIGLTFKIVHPDSDEIVHDGNSHPEELVKKNAYEKALSIARNTESGIVIGADTIVVIDNKILEKPPDRETAGIMLRSLSGREHFVYSGVAVFKNPEQVHAVDCAKTSVTFRTIPETEIEEYVASGEPLGKAGAYGIQGRGALFVDKVDGCFFNVVGLPLTLLIQLMDSVTRDNG